MGRICLTDFSLKKISCHENGHQIIKLLVRPSTTESSVSGEFVTQQWDHQHPKLRGAGRVMASPCVMRQCVGTLSSPFHRALGADWGASFISDSPLHGEGAEKLCSGSYSNMLGDRVCRFGVLLLQAHRQLFLIYVKLFIILLNHFTWWSLKHVTPACSEWQAELGNWIFGEKLTSETFCWWMCARLEQSGGSAVCAEHLKRRYMNFYDHFWILFVLLLSLCSV